MALDDNHIYTCPIEFTLDLIGGKWKGMIMWHLNMGTKRYGELQRLLPGITPKMLIQQLRELEGSGLIERKIYQQVPPKVEYSVTEWGKSIRTVLESMCQWGNQYIAGHNETVKAAEN